MKSFPNLHHELGLWKKGLLAVGIDEVGRGSFAGPLVVGTAVLKPIERNSELKKLLSLRINDSKLLSIKNRKLIIKKVQKYILFSSIQYISQDIINTKNIGFANKLGFELAAKDTAKKFRNTPFFFLTDFFKVPKAPKRMQLNIVHGDQISISIALASILAKAERDRFMEKLSVKYPSYGFEKNKGYGTLYHRTQLQKYGPCSAHRLNFIQKYT